MKANTVSDRRKKDHQLNWHGDEKLRGSVQQAWQVSVCMQGTWVEDAVLPLKHYYNFRLDSKKKFFLLLFCVFLKLRCFRRAEGFGVW